MTNEERFALFGDHDPTKYEAEARWGNTDAYKGVGQANQAMPQGGLDCDRWF